MTRRSPSSPRRPPPRRGVDRAYARFCRSGDPRALAKVFDRTAPWLLRLACHLTGERHAAEDLVQATFLVAIEDRHRFEPGRPVLAWLCGILSNRAHSWRRHRQRLVADDALVAARTGPDVATPIRQAAHAELVAALREAGPAVPRAYRIALELHLQHGLGAAEIARVLERPAGTVRAQITRGLAHLRRHLPQGLGPAAVLAFTRGDLRALRAVVLQRAAEAGTGGATWMFVGGSLLVKKLVLTGAAAAAVALMFVMWPREVRLPEEGAVGSGAAVAMVGEGRPKAPASEGASEEGRDGPRVSAPAAPDPRMAVVEGRCVDENGEPLAGCEVRLNGSTDRESVARYELQYEDIDWQDPPKQHTGTDGRFAFHFVPPPPYRYGIEVRAAERVAFRGSFGDGWHEITEGAVVSVGDVTMVRGATLRGVIVDRDGRPVTDAFASLNRKERPNPGALPYLQILPRPDGTFLLETSVAPGHWEVHHLVLDPVSMRDTGLRVVSPKVIDVPPGQTELSVEIVVEAPPPPQPDAAAIRGIVVDEAGRPVEGASVSHHYAREAALSAQDGTFRLESNGADEPSFVFVHADGYEPLRTDNEIPWGSRDARLVLRACSGLVVRVTDAVDGAPVERFGVRVFPKPAEKGPWHSADHRVRALGRHPDGVVFVNDLRRGAHILGVEALVEGAWIYAPLQEVEIGDVRGEVNVALHRPAARIVRILTSEGVPMVGSTVELLDPLDDDLTLTTRALPYDRGIEVMSSRRDAILVDQAKTADDGCVTLRGFARTSVGFRVRGDHVPLLRYPITWPQADEPLELRVSQGARIRGRIGPQLFIEQIWPTEAMLEHNALEKIQPRVRLRSLNAGSSEFPPRASDDQAPRLRDDGSFELTGVPPGSWQLVVEYRRQVPGLGLMSRYAWSIKSEILAEVALRAGDERALEIDMTHRLQARVRGVLTIDGQPCTAGTLVELAGVQQSLPEDGRLDFMVPPGTHVLQVRGIGHPLAALRCESTIVLVPGADVERDFAIRTSALRVRTLGPDGAPRAGVRVNLRAVVRGDDDHGFLGFPLTTDGEGQATFAPVAAGSYEISAGGVASTIVIVPHAADDPQQVTVQVPAVQQGGR